MPLAMPIAKRVLPPGIDLSMNGNVPAHLLSDPGDGRGNLVTPFAQAMRVLHALAMRAGIILTTTGRGRSFTQQRNLFLARYEPCSLAQYLAAQMFRRGKTWTNEHNDTGNRYWRKKQLAGGGYPATAASPGTSDHGLNLADDLAELVGGHLISLRPSTVQWLFANAPLCGMAWALKSEPWHVHNAVASPTKFVRDFLGGTIPDPDPPIVVPPTPVTPPPVVTPIPDPPPALPAHHRNEDDMVFLARQAGGLFFWGYLGEGRHGPVDRNVIAVLLNTDNCYDVGDGRKLINVNSGDSISLVTDDQLDAVYGP